MNNINSQMGNNLYYHQDSNGSGGNFMQQQQFGQGLKSAIFRTNTNISPQFQHQATYLSN